MTGLFYRTILAVLVVVLVMLIIAPLSHVIGLPLSADILLILRVCIAALALLYIATGQHWPRD